MTTNRSVPRLSCPQYGKGNFAVNSRTRWRTSTAMSSRQTGFFLCDFRFGGCWIEYMKNFKMGLVVAILTIGAAMLIVIQYEAQIKLRAENESLRQQLAQLKADNENPSNRAAQTRNSQLLPNDQLNELLRLRGEVGVLRSQLAELKNLRKENHKLSVMTSEQPKGESQELIDPGQDLIPPGQIYFKNMALSSVLRVYTNISQATVDADENVMKLSIPLTSENTNEVTRSEAIRLLEEVFQNQGGIEITHTETNQVIKINRAIFRLRQP
jgi:hypothetical protein